MGRKTIFSLVVFWLIWALAAGGAAASPRTAVITSSSTATWLPAEVNQKACETMDNYLVDRYEAIYFDGRKAADKKEMARRIGPGFADYVIVVSLSGFYDPPFTSGRLASDVKPADTVATALVDYAVYVTAADRWITGRVYHRAVYAGAAVPQAKACLDALGQTLPLLADKLAAVVK
jgi:hypothetical protein